MPNDESGENPQGGVQMKYTLKEIIGSVITLTYEYIVLAFITIFCLVAGIVKMVKLSFYFYDKQLEVLEKTLQTSSINQPLMWLCDIGTLLLMILLFIYINEAIRYFSRDRKSLLDKIVDKFEESF